MPKKKNNSVSDLLDTVEAKGLADRRSLSRALSLVEDMDEECCQGLADRFSRTGKSAILGVTGSPGVGKSTLVDRIAVEYCSKGRKVAILAVDPSSPFSGGALLGDRIRMTEASTEQNIYIRSIATRGALGGLSHSVREMVFLLEIAGFDFIILETVGVGQAEVDIVKTADCVALVLVPGMGDGVQALKAGVIEIADIFVINKSDYNGADKLHKELKHVISLATSQVHPEILKTIATSSEGITELVAEFERCRKLALESGSLAKRKSEFLSEAFSQAIYTRLTKAPLLAAKHSKLREELEVQVCKREISPLRAADKLLASLSNGSSS